MIAALLFINQPDVLDMWIETGLSFAGFHATCGKGHLTPMRHAMFFHICHATVLIAAMLALMAGGLALGAKSSDGPAATSVSQLSGEVFFTSGEGDGSEPGVASKSSYSDYNPSCGEKPTLPIYRPDLCPLVCFEPFTAVPQVYLDRFVPPQNLA